MGAILDIVGSLALRGVMVALVINLMMTLRDAEYEKTSLATTTQNLSTTARIIEKDLKYAGFNLDTLAASAFRLADSNRVEFLGALKDTSVYGYVDTINIQLADDPSGEIGSKVIARSINGGLPLYIAKGPISMKIQYYDSAGTTTTNLSKIQSVSVLLTQKVPFVVTDTASATLKKEIWVFPANLQ
jgi:hypothetical protein